VKSMWIRPNRQFLFCQPVR